jgi:hypothetical protein
MPNLAEHLDQPFGYCCQTWLAVHIGHSHFGLMPRVWFSTHLNAADNGRSSNPLLLFQDLDDAIRTNDHNSGRVFQLRHRLSLWVATLPLPAAEIADLTAEVVAAPVAAFRPQLWRIDLANIHAIRLLGLGQYPDEYLISDVIPAEYTVIAP